MCEGSGEPRKRVHTVRASSHFISVCITYLSVLGKGSQRASIISVIGFKCLLTWGISRISLFVSAHHCYLGFSFSPVLTTIHPVILVLVHSTYHYSFSLSSITRSSTSSTHHLTVQSSALHCLTSSIIITNPTHPLAPR